MSRFKLIFPTNEELAAATATEAPGVHDKVVNEKRRSLAVELDDPAGRFETLGAATERASPLSLYADRFGATVVEDYRYELDSASELMAEASQEAAEGSLDDVIALIGADRAHAQARGAGVTLCIVDTGVDGTHPEFPPPRRAGGWAPINEDPWTDWQGHGTMCMAIAGASRGPDARCIGVAPEATLVSCRTSFYDSEVTAIYDMLTARARAGEKIVASNSFGRRTGTQPPEPGPGSDFDEALDEAIEAGVIVAFSAGNNHELAGGRVDACSPNSVWLHKSRADLLAVATCDLEQRMWFYSSRGPGQYHGRPGMNDKPDVTAPTPRNGRILYGAGERVLANGWGTSGACPQVAGLAALIWSMRPDLPSTQVIQLIKDTARDIGFGPHCQGKGMIDCSEAIGRLSAV